MRHHLRTSSMTNAPWGSRSYFWAFPRSHAPLPHALVVCFLLTSLLRLPHDLNAWNRLTARMIRIRYVWMRNKSPETCNFTRQRDGQGEKIYHLCFISDVVMTRSPLFSSNLFYWPALSNWVTWNNWEKVRKNANTTFLRRFHQCCRCRILRSLLNTERIFGATLKFTDYFIDCYKYFTRYIFIILIWCNLNTKYLMALNFCGNLISWITDPFFR